MKKFIADDEVKFTVNAKELNGILTHLASDALYTTIILLHGSDRSGKKDPYLHRTCWEPGSLRVCRAAVR